MTSNYSSTLTLTKPYLSLQLHPFLPRLNSLSFLGSWSPSGYRSYRISITLSKIVQSHSALFDCVVLYSILDHSLSSTPFNKLKVCKARTPLLISNARIKTLPKVLSKEHRYEPSSLGRWPVEPAHGFHTKMQET